jgi:hypothetical protein
VSGIFPAGFERYDFPEASSGSGIARPVLRRRGRGPAVIVMHELPGLTATTVALAEAIWDRGYTVVMPILLGRPRVSGSLVGSLRNVARVCVAREFSALARGETGAIVDWLEALAESEERASGRAGVGVVGMCFSGGFAFAMARHERVKAAVASQPSIPFSFVPGGAGELGVSTEDFACIAARARGGFSVRSLRYQRDPISPGARSRRIEALPHSFTVEIPTWMPWKHSVLSNALDAVVGSDLATALADTLDYLEVQLPVDTGP